MTRLISRICGAVLALASLAVFVVDFSRISPAELALCALGLVTGVITALTSEKPEADNDRQPKSDALYEENEQLRRSLAESRAALEGLRGYIAELLPQQGGQFRESYVLMGMVFTPKQLMDKLNELTEQELAQRGLDFAVDISPALPERLCGDMPRLSLAICAMISAAAYRMESGLISLEMLAAGGGRLEFRVSDNGRQLSSETIEAALMGQYAEEYIYPARTAAIMHGDLKLRNTRTGASASLTVLLNTAEAALDTAQSI